MIIKFDIYTETNDRAGNIYHIQLTEEEIIELAKYKFFENPPASIELKHEDIKNIYITETII